ncbi:MAG: NAD(P)H-hydrate epimerase [Coriobacteriia bacterium]|nr:NAD(P)H-hydrate epimerase [Coriobacteriia bacterium]
MLGTDVLSVDQIRELERQIVEQGTSLFELMQRAGHSVCDHVFTISAGAMPVVVFCGSGNNGGDGWVIAGELAKKGYSVVLVTARVAEALSAEPARTAALEVVARRLPGLTVCLNPSQGELARLLESAALVVDAILGIGSDGGSIKEPYAGWIEAINVAKAARENLYVVAVDVPSGLNAQTGAAACPTVVADATITMLAFKPGLLVESAKHYCGDVRLARLIT